MGEAIGGEGIGNESAAQVSALYIAAEGLASRSAVDMRIMEAAGVRRGREAEIGGERLSVGKGPEQLHRPSSAENSFAPSSALPLGGSGSALASDAAKVRRESRRALVPG
jgi:hypothetical protein